MYGRFALTHDRSTLKQWAQAVFTPDFGCNLNIVPGTSVIAIRATPRGRTGTLMRWGFIPAWATGPAALPMLHNARGETIAGKPMFRQAFEHRRCLIPASGFYEWKVVPGQKAKQLFFISLKDGNPMALAGLWESAGIPSSAAETCAIVTIGANAVMEPIHPRMPLLLEREDWEAWLDPDTADLEMLAKLVKPSSADKMQAWGVAHAVDKVDSKHAAQPLPIA